MPGFNARNGAFQAAVIPFVAFPFNSLCQFSPAHPRPAVGFDIVWSRKYGIAAIASSSSPWHWCVSDARWR
jgi:hypothetical protein